MTSDKIIRLTNFDKYLHNDESETEVNINISANDGSEKVWGGGALRLLVS
jgi:hypothetical protein